MTSLVGTIFHFGMSSSTCVRRVTTTGCGFTFSDIYSTQLLDEQFSQAKTKAANLSSSVYLAHWRREDCTVPERWVLPVQQQRDGSTHGLAVQEPAFVSVLLHVCQNVVQDQYNT
jgi:hypothetical protein